MNATDSRGLALRFRTSAWQPQTIVAAVQIGLHDIGGPGKKLVESSIWEWRGPTQDEGDEASAWLTKYLGKDVRLVRLLSGAPPLHPVPSTPVPSTRV